MKKVWAISFLLLAIALVIHESKLPARSAAPAASRASVAVVKPIKAAERPLAKVVPDEITNDKSNRHWVEVNPYTPGDAPLIMRTAGGGWSKPERVYAGSGMVAYTAIEETADTLKARPTENWWTGDGFGMTVLKDYKNASPEFLQQQDQILEDAGMPIEARREFRFVNEAVFFSTPDHTYVVVGRKYIDRYGETIHTTPEGFREVLDVNASSPGVDRVASLITSTVMHRLSDRQHEVLSAMGFR